MSDPELCRGRIIVTRATVPPQPARPLTRADVAPAAAQRQGGLSGGAPDRPGRSGAPKYPILLDQQRSSGGTMLVTWALPNLRRATVRVPYDSWLNGEHHRVGAQLAAHHPADVWAPEPAMSDMTSTELDSVLLDDYVPPD